MLTSRRPAPWEKDAGQLVGQYYSRMTFCSRCEVSAAAQSS
jgi:hypothetical protein